MALVDAKNKAVHAKLVYYGPGLCGKTTNLQYVNSKLVNGQELMSLATEGDRTIFFDFMPLDMGTIRGLSVKFKLYTVPGQVRYNQTRKMVLKNADGIVFVADSQREMLDSNQESLDNLFSNMAELGLDPAKVPVVLQYNKRDLPTAMPPEELDRHLNQGGFPTFEASAVVGTGVVETLKGACVAVMRQLSSHFGEPAVAAAQTGPSVARAGPALTASRSGAAVAAARAAPTEAFRPRTPVSRIVDRVDRAREEASAPAAAPAAARSTESGEMETPVLAGRFDQLLALVETRADAKEVAGHIARIDAKLDRVRDALMTALDGLSRREPASTEKLRVAVDRVRGELEASSHLHADIKQALPGRGELTGLRTQMLELTDKVARIEGAVRPVSAELVEVRKRLEALPGEATLRSLAGPGARPGEGAGRAAPTADLQGLRTLIERALATRTGPSAEDLQAMIERALATRTGPSAEALRAEIDRGMEAATGALLEPRLAALEKRFEEMARRQAERAAAAAAKAVQARMGELVSRLEEKLEGLRAAAPAPVAEPAAASEPEPAREPAPAVAPEPEPAEQAAPEETAEQAPEETAEQAPEAPAEQAPEAPAGQAPEEPAGQAPEGPAGQAPEGPAEHAPEEPAGQAPEGASGGEPAEATPGAPAEPGPDLSDDPAHKNAARVARVMMADLYLYHREEVEEGLRNDDFAERNREALEDMRTTYEARVPEEVRAQKDHLSAAIESFLAKKRAQLGLT